MAQQIPYSFSFIVLVLQIAIFGIFMQTIGHNSIDTYVRWKDILYYNNFYSNIPLQAFNGYFNISANTFDSGITDHFAQYEIAFMHNLHTYHKHESKRQNLGHCNTSGMLELLNKQQQKTIMQDFTGGLMTFEPHLILVLGFVSIGAVLVAITTIYFCLRHRQNNALLSSKLLEFHNGHYTGLGASGLEVAKSLRYERERHEISRRSFEIDFTKSLGSGQFGAAYFGTLKNTTSQEPSNSLLLKKIVVKTLKKRYRLKYQSAVSTHRDLLFEINILSYLGKHKIIIGLYEANTEKYTNGCVFVISELCSFWTLERHLRSLKAPLSLNMQQGKSSGDETSSDDEVKLEAMLNHLYKWNDENACVMQYIIASNMLMRGDLATRNILLRSKRIAQISDFGLPRRRRPYWLHWLPLRQIKNFYKFMTFWA